MKRIIIYNNSLTYREYHANIELDTGKVFYKTNTLERLFFKGRPRFYECFFLVPDKRLNDFIAQSSVIETWQESYGRGHCIDGYYWSIEAIYADNEREIKGANGKPEGFDDFIVAIETLLQKDFGAKDTEWCKEGGKSRMILMTGELL